MSRVHRAVRAEDEAALVADPEAGEESPRTSFEIAFASECTSCGDAPTGTIEAD
jgi:hypothetical protein